MSASHSTDPKLAEALAECERLELTELPEAGKIGLFGAGTEGEEFEIVGEGI